MADARPRSPERRIERIRNRLERRVEGWRRALAARIGRERREVRARIEEIRASLAAGELSDQGAAFIARFEGIRLAPYNDPAGHATIGIGHLIHLGPVTDADRRAWYGFTRERALELLRRDADHFEQAIRELVTVRLDQQEFDALVSFAFNVGTGAFAGSTLLRRLNAGERGAVPTELNRWTKAGGVELPGLVARRHAEGRLFAGHGYGN